MSTNSQELHRVFVEVRVRGESEEQAAHEWAYLQIWDQDSVIDLLRKRLGKSESDVRSLLKSYDRFHVNMTIKPDALNFPLVGEELLAEGR